MLLGLFISLYSSAQFSLGIFGSEQGETEAAVTYQQERERIEVYAEKNFSSKPVPKIDEISIDYKPLRKKRALSPVYFRRFDFSIPQERPQHASPLPPHSKPKISSPDFQKSTPDVAEVKPITEEELTKIQADIFHDKLKLHYLSFGLYLHLADSRANEAAKQLGLKFFSLEGKTVGLKKGLAFSINESIKASIHQYKKGNIELALSNLTPIDSHLKQITQARLLAQAGDYEKAFTTYKKISTDSPYWIDSLIEKGWIQILLGDNPAAIGNMYSLRGFNNLLLIDRPLIQAIGYLNLCQYADALHTTESALKINRHYLDVVSDPPKNLYSMVKRFIRTQRTTLYSPILLELSRDPVFLNIQKSINKIEDERQIYIKVGNQLLKAEKVPEYKLVAAKARKAVQQHRKSLFKDLQRRKKILLTQANDSLNSRLKKITNNLNYQLQQLEFIKFEIYEKSGDHLRQKLAGVPHGNETHKLKQESDLSWSFDGEIWEDEIGNFRTSLKSECKTTDGKLNAKIKHGGQ